MNNQAIAFASTDSPQASTYARPRLIEGGLSHNRRQRLVTAFVGAFIGLLVMAMSWLYVDEATQARIDEALSQATLEMVTVMPGDTLWQIAERHPVDGCTTSQLVDYIRCVNDLSQSSLSVGMRLEVPTIG